MKKILLLLTILLVIIGCQQPQVNQPVQVGPPADEYYDTTNQPVERPTVEDTADRSESVIAKPVKPEIDPSHDMDYPEVKYEDAVEVGEKLETAEQAMNSGSYVIGKEGEDFIHDLKCDLGTNILSFALVNTQENTYSLEKASVFNLPQGMYPMRLSVNGREIRDIDARCGDTKTFAPGDDVKCSLKFAPNSMVDRVMIRVGPDEFGKPLTNLITFQSSYDQSQVQFVCREAESSDDEPVEASKQ